MTSPIAPLRQVVDFGLRHRRSAAVVGAFGILGVMSALLDQGPEQGQNSLNDAWSLPSVEEVILASDVEVMLANPLFGGEPIIPEPELEAGEIAKKAPGDEWRLMGIVTEGNTKHVVIFNVTAGKIVTARLGEILPGGEELLSIGANEIEFNDFDESKTLSLFADVKN